MLPDEVHRVPAPHLDELGDLGRRLQDLLGHAGEARDVRVEDRDLGLSRLEVAPRVVVVLEEAGHVAGRKAHGEGAPLLVEVDDALADVGGEGGQELAVVGVEDAVFGTAATSLPTSELFVMPLMRTLSSAPSNSKRRSRAGSPVSR